jgi:diaminopimelate decarboxylase
MKYRGKDLFCEDVALADIAKSEGTPCYVYSGSGILDRYREYDDAFGDAPHQVCYAVKANSNLAVLRLLAQAGAGFDIVSGGELFRVLNAGGDPSKVVFSGVGKTEAELTYALREKVEHFNCESEPELALLDALAGKLGVRPHVALRVNPDVDAVTHPYISTGLREHKFGIGMAEAEAVYQRSGTMPNVILDGVSCHIGSQILDIEPLLQAVGKTADLVERLRAQGLKISTLDLGGGIGVAYKSSETAPSIATFIHAACAKLSGRGLELLIEPGRSIVAEAGVLLTRVLYRKHNGAREFVIVDAAMNDLIRPALYQSHHEIIPVRLDKGRPRICADVVGPVCESGDFFARNREVANVLPGDLMAICTAGAYGFVASSNYNSRPRAAEVLVEGSSFRVVRRRETYEDLILGE